MTSIMPWTKGYGENLHSSFLTLIGNSDDISYELKNMQFIPIQVSFVRNSTFSDDFVVGYSYNFERRSI